MIQLVANQIVNIQDHGQDAYGRMLGTIYLKSRILIPSWLQKAWPGHIAIRVD